MDRFGADGEYSFLSINHLRSLLKTIIAGVVQNPPSFKAVAVNTDADAMEAAALYQNVLEYYSRETALNAKITKAVELGVVLDTGFLMTYWDPFASDADSSGEQGIWRGAPCIKVLTPFDVCYDITRDAWENQDLVIVRLWESRQKVAAQFPELHDEVMGCRLRGEITDYDMNSAGRYDLTSFQDVSDDIQIFHLYHKNTSWMPGGRFVMALETGKMLFESPSGMVYPKLPVDRFVCEEQVDILLGHSPMQELIGCQEAINSLASAIQTNTNNFSNQYVTCEYGTQINPRTLESGQKLLEYSAGSKPPAGLNLTAIPDALFKHLGDLMAYMEKLPSISTASRGEAPGANSTGSGMLFLASQTNANQGAMAENFARFAASVQTALLHVLRIFARNEKTIALMGKNNAGRSIVLATELQDFDSVIVEQGNPVLNTPQGRIAMAQQLLQFGGVTPQQALEVVSSGNLGPAMDGSREQLYELNLENEWLQAGDEVLVNALDAHEAHIAAHVRLLSIPWLRNPKLAAKLNIQNGPAIMQVIQGHITEHMNFLAQNQTGQVQTQSGAAPGEAQGAPSPAMGHSPPAPPGGAPAAPGAPQPAPNGQAQNPAAPAMPAPPSMPLAH